MKIECKLKRQGGTKVTIGGTEYHFAPQTDGAHVAEVSDDAHIDRFLSIAEAYRLYRAAKPDPVKQTAPTDTNEDAETGDADGDGDADRNDLVKQYEAKFGKKPHGKWSVDKIREALSEE